MVKMEELWVNGFTGLKKSFITIMEGVERPGRDELLYYLETKTDFYAAPASAKGHNNYPGGLVEHSIITYFILKRLVNSFPEFENLLIHEDSLIICSLLHDICKTNFYSLEYKQIPRKNPDGSLVYDDFGKKIWDTEKVYVYNDKFPLGHGEKSVIMIQNLMALTPHEQMAIRWHMGGFDDTARSYAGGVALSGALQKYPLVTFLHAADLFACLPEPEQKNIIPGPV